MRSTPDNGSGMVARFEGDSPSAGVAKVTFVMLSPCSRPYLPVAVSMAPNFCGACIICMESSITSARHSRPWVSVIKQI